MQLALTANSNSYVSNNYATTLWFEKLAVHS